MSSYICTNCNGKGGKYQGGEWVWCNDCLGSGRIEEDDDPKQGKLFFMNGIKSIC